MYHPFLNLEEKTDDELLETLNTIYARLNHASSYGQNQMVAELNIMIDQIIEEQDRRIRKSIEEQLKKKKIDTSANITLGDIEGENDDQHK